MNLDTLVARVDERLQSVDHQGGVLWVSPNVALSGRREPTELRAAMYEPVVCLILQGAKELSAGDKTFTIGPGQCLLVSHDIPVSACITTASPQHPYLSLVLRLDVGVLRSLYEEVSDVLDSRVPARSAGVHDADAALIDAFARMVALPEEPVERRVIEPMLLREIHFRLLMAPHGGMLRQLLRHDSHASNVARAIHRIRSDFRTAIAVPDLAKEVGMSVSSFHKHFREITANTPLQYQKELRLLEARRLLTAGDQPVTTVAYNVGYASPNQFSREYARKFGVSPRTHLAQPSAG